MALLSPEFEDLIKYEDLKTDEDKAVDIKNLPKEYGNNITVTGHSKGGNKANMLRLLQIE